MGDMKIVNTSEVDDRQNSPKKLKFHQSPFVPTNLIVQKLPSLLPRFKEPKNQEINA
uniref:Uncharacterized protein n=1 Tax=Rhizophora mucronata TaxID=61149 RepID=A0A2P2N324_RHIMU